MLRQVKFKFCRSDMMSYEFYKIIHILGLVLLFFSLGALIFHSLSGGEKKFALRKFLMIQHGIGLLLVLTGGFGLLARTDAQVTEVWVIIKIMICSKKNELKLYFRNNSIFE